MTLYFSKRRMPKKPRGSFCGSGSKSERRASNCGELGRRINRSCGSATTGSKAASHGVRFKASLVRPRKECLMLFA